MIKTERRERKKLKRIWDYNMKNTKFNLIKSGFFASNTRGKSFLDNSVRSRNDYFHKFAQEFDIQTTYEIRPFFWWSYKRKVGMQAIPTGLCSICHLLQIEHYE